MEAGYAEHSPHAGALHVASGPTGWGAKRNSPVGALHVALPLRAGGAAPLLVDAVVSLEGEVEVSVAVVLTVITEDEDDWE